MAFFAGFVDVDVKAVFAASDRTYQVEWTETNRGLAGQVESEERRKGSFTIAVNPPSDERLIRINPLGIYVHIPFCRKRCHFCYFKVYTDKDSAAIRGYLEGVLRELTLYSQKPLVGGRKPNFVYFGGGTP